MSTPAALDTDKSAPFCEEKRHWLTQALTAVSCSPAQRKLKFFNPINIAFRFTTTSSIQALLGVENLTHFWNFGGNGSAQSRSYRGKTSLSYASSRVATGIAIRTPLADCCEKSVTKNLTVVTTKMCCVATAVLGYARCRLYLKEGRRSVERGN